MANFIIEFEALTIKTNTDKLHTIFLLKKNVWADIIKTILGCLPIATPEILKEWKVAITLVGQEYKSTEGYYDYWIGTGTTYRTRGLYMDIRKSNKSF